jgi:hypothetical protein
MRINWSGIAAFVMLPIVTICTEVCAQNEPEIRPNTSPSNNRINAVPFLLITPDPRVAAMGDAGVAADPDANSASVNPSKLAFIDSPVGFSASYSPWLKDMVSEMHLAYLSGFCRLTKNSTLGSSVRILSLGKIRLIDRLEQDIGVYSPTELAVDIAYAQRFGERLSLGTSIRYIQSNVQAGQTIIDQDANIASAVAVDMSAFYKAPVMLFGVEATMAAGVNISNVGTKMYDQSGAGNYLPSNLKIGGASTFMFDEYNKFSLVLDFNKPLAPNRHASASRHIAPGGFLEELRDVSVGTGGEYWFAQQFVLRAGYFYEDPDRGNRRYITSGAGLKYKSFNIDFSYLIASAEKSPVANTVRFSLLFNFGS